MILNINLIKKFINTELILAIIISFSTILNVIYNYNKIKFIPITIFLITLYLLLTKRKNKLKIILLYLSYALCFGFAEYLVITYTNGKAISYQKELTFFKLPYWLLFGAYPTMVINLLLINDFWNIIIN